MQNKKYLTTKEAAEKLNISVPTIYKYVREKKLVPVYEDKWKIDETLLFHPDDIERLIEQFRKPGLTTGEVAKALNIHPTTVASYINQGLIQATKHHYRGRNIYFITKEEVELFKEKHHLQKDKEKKAFYSQQHKLYLYQTLVNESNEVARIMELNESDGKVVTEDGRTFPLSNLKEEGFSPRENFKEKKYITKRGYAVFTFEKPNHISSPVFHVIEIFYRVLSYKNMKLIEDSHSIQVEIKPTQIDGITRVKNPYEIKLLQEHLVEGNVSVREEGILINSELEPILIHVPSSLKGELKIRASDRQETLEEYVINMLLEGVKSEEK